MRNKNILIIEEDEVVLSLMQKSIIGLDPGAQVIAQSSPDGAVSWLVKTPFDLIITDLYFLQNDTKNLCEAIRTFQNPQPVLIASSYSNNSDQGTIDASFIKYLISKPLDINQFNSTIAQALGVKKDDKLEAGSLPDDLYQEIEGHLRQLHADTNARCILLSDTAGRVLLDEGNTNGLSIDAITSLLGGGIATLLEAGKNVDDQDVINLAYREGKFSDLYAINILKDWVLIIVIDRGDLYQRLGSVWFYARQTVLRLGKIMEKLSEASSAFLFDERTQQAYNDEIDKLFGE